MARATAASRASCILRCTAMRLCKDNPRDVGHRLQKNGIVLPEVAGRIAIDFENAPNHSVYGDWHVQERYDAVFSDYGRYPQVRFTDEVVDDQRLTRLKRLSWHGAWIQLRTWCAQRHRVANPDRLRLGDLPRPDDVAKPWCD